MSNHILTAPCPSCPFRKDVPCYLRQDRREEIARTLQDGQWFPCHNTVDYSQEDEEGYTEPNTAKAKSCAGAVKALAMVGGTTQLDRISERLNMGSIERTAAHTVETWDLNEWVRLAEGATGEDPIYEIEEVETCNTVDYGCLAPAGFLNPSGGVSEGTVAADEECKQCGEAVCSNCISEDGLCGNCAPEEDD